MPSAPIPQNDLLRLATLHSYSVLDTLPERGFDDITALATFICGTPVSLVSFVDQDRQWFKSAVGFNGRSTGRAESFCAHTIHNSAETLVVEDTTLDPRFSDNPLVLGDPRIRFYAGAPLVAPNGHVLGTLCVIDTKPRVLSPAQATALAALSRQVMELLESRHRLIASERSSAALLQTEKLAAVGRLASSMAHGINNPLEAVTNLIYLARLRSQDPNVQTWLDQADQQLRRVATVANQALLFHKQSSHPSSITCLELFSTTLEVYEPQLRNAGITVEKRKRANRPVQCFEADIRQVLSNIITNSIHAMPNGGRLLVRSRVATHWKSGRTGIMLTLADTGAGMDPITRSRVFEAFFSTKGIGGSGLGLWISADIMHRHGGAISIRSSPRPGRSGTVVTLFLPFKSEDPPTL